MTLIGQGAAVLLPLAWFCGLIWLFAAGFTLLTHVAFDGVKRGWAPSR